MGGYKIGKAAYMLQYWRDRPESYLWWAAKKRSSVLGIKFDIDVSDINIPEYCPILDVKLSQVRSGDKTYAPSLDRIDNTLGYIKNNIRVISWKANKYKSDMSPNDIRKLYEYTIKSGE